MPTKHHKDMVNYILASTARINPHKHSEGRVAYVYAAGFLASYLANILAEDPFRIRQFQKHVDAQAHRKNNTKS